MSPAISIPSPRSRKRPRIEIIPLIDIVFFLFATFVMVSLSMVKNQGIPVHLPIAATAGPQAHEHAAVVTIAEGGSLYFNKEAVTPVQLDEALKGFLAANPDPVIFINGDTKAEFGSAIAVLDQVRALGIDKVAIETRPRPVAP